MIQNDDIEQDGIFNHDVTLPHLSDITDLLVGEAMKRSEGNQSLAARLLGVSQPALNKRLKKNEFYENIDRISRVSIHHI